MKTKKLNHQKGYTLIEVLVVISIISFIGSSMFYSFNLSRAKARDAVRVSILRIFRDGLERYHIDNGKYPDDATGNSSRGFDYEKTNPDGSCPCVSSCYISTKQDNSASPDFLPSLYPDYISISDWNDPLDPDIGPPYSPFNCRYVAIATEQNADNVQHYLLHCKLEANPELEKNDGGTNDNLYEIIGGDPWICVTDIPS